MKYLKRFENTQYNFKPGDVVKYYDQVFAEFFKFDGYVDDEPLCYIKTKDRALVVSCLNLRLATPEETEQYLLDQDVNKYNL